MSFANLTCASAGEYESKLIELLEQKHNQAWQSTAAVPPWSLTVVTSELENDGRQRQQDFVFAYHHALMDGTSGAMFHEELLSALNDSSTDTHQGYILDFAAKVDLPPPREDVIPFKLKKRFVGKAVWHEYAPKAIQRSPTPIWPTEPINLATVNKTRLIPIDIPSERLTELLKACRSHDSTLTGLLHAMVGASLARRINPEQAESFKAITPIDYRRLPGQIPGVYKAYKGAMANCFTIAELKFRADDVAALRKPGDSSPDLYDATWSQARRVSRLLAQQRARLPVNDTIMLLRYVPVMDNFVNKDGQKREDSWEFSNIGALKVPRLRSVEADSLPWRITRAFFSSSSQAIGPAIAIRAISVPGGPLCLTLIWQESVVPKYIMAGLAADIGDWAAGILQM